MSSPSRRPHKWQRENTRPWAQRASGRTDLRVHSCTSYSKATPSGSFSSNHVPRRRYLDMVGIADLLARIDRDRPALREPAGQTRTSGFRRTRQRTIWIRRGVLPRKFAVWRKFEEEKPMSRCFSLKPLKSLALPRESNPCFRLERAGNFFSAGSCSIVTIQPYQWVKCKSCNRGKFPGELGGVRKGRVG